MKKIWVLGLVVLLSGCTTDNLVVEDRQIKDEQKEELSQENTDSFCYGYRMKLEDIKVGQKYGELVVKDVKPFYQELKLDWSNVQIDFEGEVTLEGEYSILPEGMVAMGGRASFSLLSDQDEEKMPVFKECQPVSFIFSDETKARDLLGVGRGRAIIVVKNFSIRNYPTETIDQAEIVKAIEKVKYPDSWNYWEKKND